MLHASGRACLEVGAITQVNIGATIRVVAIVLACCFAVAATADAVPDQEAEIQVKKSGDTVIVDVTLSMPASLRETWDVLTDYDHMAQFLPNLQFSKIIETADNKILVSQKGQVTYGPLTFSFDSVREVVLTPYSEIRSQVISGSIKQARGTTHLVPDGETTRIVHHSESVSGIWVPPFVGKKIIAGEIREQYDAMRKEILRRKTAAQQH